MAGNAPDLMGLLCLDPRFSKSPFGGNHRTVVIGKDYTNSGDFVFNNLLQHFGRREPNSQILLVTMSHDWLHYSAAAAKCGFNLRQKQNMGNIQVLDIMAKSLDDACNNIKINYCDHIRGEVEKFIKQSQAQGAQDQQQPSSQVVGTKIEKPIVIMFDDVSLLLALGSQCGEVFQLVSDIDVHMRRESDRVLAGRLSHLIVQTQFTNIRTRQTLIPQGKDLNFLISSLNNLCDISITLKPLETGHSTRVDGTIKVNDNRLLADTKSGDASNRPATNLPMSILTTNSCADIGSKKAYFYKLGDRRVRLTSNALIF